MPSSRGPRPITILQIIPDLETGGAERTTIEIAAALVKRGDRALVASRGGRLEKDLTALGATLIRFDAASKNPLTMGRNAARLAQIIRREGIDLVHARSRAPAWSALAACRRTGAPFVTTYHGIYGEKGRAKRLYNSVMARGDMVIANSRYTAKLIQSRYGTAPERIAVIPRGVDLASFSPDAVSAERRAALRRAWGLDEADRVVLNLARLTAWKGQVPLIEAAAEFRTEAGLVFVLAGDDQGRSAYRQMLENRIAKFELGSRVRLAGHCEDVPAALALAKVAVVASTEPEAFGRAALEAQAMGLPVVATDLGAAPETVLAPPLVEAPARTGWLVPPNRPNELAAAIKQALGLPDVLRTDLAGRARRQAETFSTESMQSATLAVYDALLGGKTTVPVGSQG